MRARRPTGRGDTAIRARSGRRAGVSPPRSAAAQRRAASRRPRARPRCRAQPPRCRRVVRSFHLDLIVLDQRIGEELVGRLLERGLRRFAIASLDLDVEDLALAHARYAGYAERFERAFDRLALGIEDAGFEGDADAGLHRRSTRIPYPANPFNPNPP